MSAELSVGSAPLKTKPITVDLVYPRLISVNQDIVSMEMVYEFCNPFSTSLPVEKAIGAEVIGDENVRHEFYVNYSKAVLIPVYLEKTINETVMDNETKEEKIIKRTMSYLDHYTVKKVEDFKPIKDFYIPAYSCVKIKHITKGKPRFHTSPIDIIPKTDLP